MNLRDAIHSEILHTHGEDVGMHDIAPAYIATDAILTLIREALTSDAAVRAAVALTQTPDIEHDADVMGVSVAEIRAADWKQAQDAITAALDAVTGEEH